MAELPLESTDAFNFQRLFEQLPEHYVILDPDLRIVAVTDSYLDVTMRERKHVLGQQLFEAFPNDPLQSGKKYINTIKESLDRVRREQVSDTLSRQQYNIRQPSDQGGEYEERFWDISSTPILTANKHLDYIIYRVQDVTSLVQLERSSAEHDQITETLYQKAQQHERQQAEMTERIRDDFLSVAAHELRTPVTSLRGYAQFLLRMLRKGDVPDQERLQRALTSIDQQSIKLIRFVEQLLDVSRINAGKLVLQRSETDIAALMYETVAGIKRMHSHRVFTVMVQEPLTGFIDGLRIEQVLNNVLMNAVKFSPNGGTIDLTASQREDGWLSISIADHGVGIADEHRPFIFKRFYQAHETGYFSGLGVGLSISKYIVELHGGTIDAEFPADGGTRIHIRLPIEA